VRVATGTLGVGKAKKTKLLASSNGASKNQKPKKKKKKIRSRRSKFEEFENTFTIHVVFTLDLAFTQ
jgi:hypothetical protein